MPKANWAGGGTGALGGAATGATIGSVVPGIGTAIGAGVGGLIGGLGGLFGGGKKPKIQPQSTLSPQQEALKQQLIDAGMGPGAGGAFGTVADYYRDLASDNPADLQAFTAPALRQYNEDIVPGISEQFAGMGSGGLSSSGFRNAQIQGATDLSERLGAMRANLRQRGIEGLQNIGTLGLGNYNENVRETPQPGFAENLFEGIGQILPSVAQSYLSKPNTNNTQNQTKFGSTGAYGKSGPQASPQIGNGPGFKLPTFMQR